MHNSNGFESEIGWSATTIILKRGTEEFILVYDEPKGIGGKTVYWKFAGGKKEDEDMGDPENTARRELEGETGIIAEELTFIKKEFRKHPVPHYMYFYTGQVDSFDSRKEMGDEGERIAIFTLNEIRELPDFFPSHRNILEQLGILQASTTR